MTKRTKLQNKSLHKYCDQIAESMREAGIDQKKFFEMLKEGMEIPVTMHMVKDVFRAVGKDMYKIESTSQLDTVPIQKVYEAVDLGFTMKFEISHPWPSEDSQSEAQR